MFSITVTANTIDELYDKIREFLPEAKPVRSIESLTPQEVLAYAEGVAAKEGIVLNGHAPDEEPQPKKLSPTSPEAKAKEAADKKAAARKRLKAELDASLALEAEKKDDEVAAAKEKDEDIKTRLVPELQGLWNAGRKDIVKDLLARYGDGLQHFASIPASKFRDIEASLRKAL